jgi:preprotein translocase subunit SecE
LLKRSASEGGEQIKCLELRLGQLEKIVNDWIHIGIWAVVIGAVFGYLWWQGQIQRLAVYVQETREELRKCSWPTWEELKGSTALIIVAVALLGGFIVLVDYILGYIFIYR